MLDRVSISNGIDWSSDGRHYYVDSGAHRVDLLGADRSAFFELPSPEAPDGLCVDSDDHVWVASWGGSRVLRLSPAGEVVAEVRLPAPHVSSVAFGGDDLARPLHHDGARGTRRGDDRRPAALGLGVPLAIARSPGRPPAVGPVRWPVSLEPVRDRADHRVVVVDEHQVRPPVERRARVRDAEARRGRPASGRPPRRSRRNACWSLSPTIVRAADVRAPRPSAPTARNGTGKPASCDTSRRPASSSASRGSGRDSTRVQTSSAGRNGSQLPAVAAARASLPRTCRGRG